jgi:hypothetical protein
MDGFAIGLSDRFLLLHLVEQTIQLNGYTVMRLADITSWEDHPYGEFVLQALRGRGEAVRPLDSFPLDDHATVLGTVKERWPLVAIHTEKADSTRCWIGRVVDCSAEELVLRKINPLAQWIELERFRYRDITRIDWGGLYEQALWEVNSGEPSTAGRKAGPIKVNGKVSFDPQGMI